MPTDKQAERLKERRNPLRVLKHASQVGATEVGNQGRGCEADTLRGSRHQVAFIGGRQEKKQAKTRRMKGAGTWPDKQKSEM